MEGYTLRALERIIVVIIGGLSVYLGYRLFLHVPSQKDGQGKISFPGGMSIIVNRVGPGVFFALFGAGVVALSLYHGVVYYQETGKAPAKTETALHSQVEFFSGLMQGGPNKDKNFINRRRRELRLEVEFVNSLGSIVKAGLSEPDLRYFNDRRSSIKLALMSMVWQSDWGSFDNFKLWVESGAADPVPGKLETAANYYRSGLEDGR